MGIVAQNLKRGLYRHLTADEINQLLQMAKAAKPGGKPKRKR